MFLQFQKDDGLPQTICKTCIVLLSQASSFANVCCISDSTLRLSDHEDIEAETKNGTNVTEDLAKEEMRIQHKSAV